MTSLEVFEEFKGKGKYDCELCDNEGHLFGCCVCGRDKEVKDE